MSNKERWQKLAGIIPVDTSAIKESDSKKLRESLTESFNNLGMATPGVMGNPFGVPAVTNLEDSLKEMHQDDDVELVDDRVNVEDDDEGRMAKGQLEQMFNQADTLLELMPDDAQLEGWVQSKLTLACEMLDVVTHYLLDEAPEEEEYHGPWEEEDLDEGKKKGLWDNIHAKRKRGEKPAEPGDEDYPDKKAWDKVTKEGVLDEAEYQGRKVKLNKPMRGDVKKFKVYVKNPKGNVVKVNFGDPDMRIKKSDPKARKSFRARHNCDNPGPKHKARYWSCRKW